MSASGRTWPRSCDGVNESHDGGLSTVKLLAFFFLNGERGQGSGERSDLEEHLIGEVEDFFFFLEIAGGSPVLDGSE